MCPTPWGRKVPGTERAFAPIRRPCGRAGGCGAGSQFLALPPSPDTVEVQPGCGEHGDQLRRRVEPDRERQLRALAVRPYERPRRLRSAAQLIPGPLLEKRHAALQLLPLPLSEPRGERDRVDRVQEEGAAGDERACDGGGHALVVGLLGEVAERREQVQNDV